MSDVTSQESSEADLRSQPKAALSAFEHAGGPGLELADRIDSLRAELRSLASKKGAGTRGERASERAAMSQLTSVEERQATEYALAKQVPDIACHAVFETSYGQLRLDYEHSQKVAALVERLLRRKLKRMTT